MNTATLNRNPLWAYLQLLRPANIVTAWADILAGFAASGYVGELTPLAWLLLATTGLYGGGIVFNDVFDAKLDAEERPERPIPSGRASVLGATILGSIFLSVGLIAALQVSTKSATVAAIVACMALLYDAVGKHNAVLGPINMGVCRGGNLLLGVSVVPTMVGEYWYLALIAIAYIAGITTLSRDEVKVGKSTARVVALSLVVIVIFGLLGLGLLNNYKVLTALPFIILFAAQVLLPFIKAVRQPTPEQIRIAVKTGVLCLIVLDATFAAGFASWSYGLLLLSLLPISMAIARIFTVT
jgi:4-hydroxybenzoate polyprenyltransferase